MDTYDFLLQHVLSYLSDQAPFVCINRRWYAEWRRQFTHKFCIVSTPRQIHWYIETHGLDIGFVSYQMKYAAGNLLYEFIKYDVKDLFEIAVKARRHEFVDHLLNRGASKPRLKILIRHSDQQTSRKYKALLSKHFAPKILLHRAICAGNFAIIEYASIAGPRFTPEETLDILQKCRKMASFAQLLNLVINKGNTNDFVIHLLYNLVQSEDVATFIALEGIFPRQNTYEGIYKPELLNYLWARGDAIPRNIFIEGSFYPLPSVIQWFINHGIEMTPEALRRLTRFRGRSFEGKEAQILENICTFYSLG